MRYVIRWQGRGSHGYIAIEIDDGRWIRGRVVNDGIQIPRRESPYLADYVNGTARESIRLAALHATRPTRVYESAEAALDGVVSKYEDSHGEYSR